MRHYVLPLLLLFTTFLTHAQPTDSAFVRANYTKLDRQIPMRDGTRLYTIIYVPKDASPASTYPILMQRTPYSAGPYGEANYPRSGPGPSAELSREQYIFVHQDVRGRYMSEGTFQEMTPTVDKRRFPNGAALDGAAPDGAATSVAARQQRSGTAKRTATTLPTDESTDTYDTIAWLLKNVPNHNGRVGLLGISYPGFYATAALPDAHPALVAVSPQAPVTDEFIGDDARHNGAFFLMDNFLFMNYFDAPRTGPVDDYPPVFAFKPTNLYDFFLKLGAVRNANKPEYFNNRAKIWNEYLAHDTYDPYWQSRDIRRHLRNVRPATLVVGGWFDAENLFGALRTYEAIEQRNPQNRNYLVMGPWAHGSWARADWSRFGPLAFGQNTAKFFRDSIETGFFNHHLKNKGPFGAAEATVFDTGLNQWRTVARWPAPGTLPQAWFLAENGALRSQKPAGQSRYTEYVSDPANPVPYSAKATETRRNNQYMIEDQRFASQRPDVVSFVGDVLTQPLTVAGPLTARLFVSTTGTDADFIVKLIDVQPDSTQRLVRAEVMRGRFRNSFEKPEPFVPGQVTAVRFTLPDAFHTFRPGHRLMVQVQSSWFPLVDRNPQTFKTIADVVDTDFRRATIRIHHDARYPSSLTLPVLP